MDGTTPTYGLSYSGTPTSDYGIPYSSMSGSPNYGQGWYGSSGFTTPSTGGTSASVGSSGIPWGGLALGAGALYGYSQMGRSPGINPDPYGMGAQMGAEAQQLWGRYNKGEMNPGDESRIAQWEQQQTKAVQDYYQKAGLGDSSMAKEAAAQVGVHAQNMRQQANQALLGPAIQATGLANQYAQQLLQYQLYQDQQKRSAMSNFMGTIGTIAGAYFGGPAGAAAGGEIGSQMGG